MNPYEVLGVAPDAKVDEIRRAYRSRAMECHPDREGGDETEFKKLQEAYDILLDEERRAFFDEHGAIELDPFEFKVRGAITGGVLKAVKEGAHNPIKVVFTQMDTVLASFPEMQKDLNKRIKSAEVVIKSKKTHDFLRKEMEKEVVRFKADLASLPEVEETAREVKRRLGEMLDRSVAEEQTTDINTFLSAMAQIRQRGF